MWSRIVQCPDSQVPWDHSYRWVGQDLGIGIKWLWVCDPTPSHSTFVQWPLLLSVGLYWIEDWGYLIIILIPMTMFIVLSSWPQVIARVNSVHLMNVDQRQAAVDPQTKLCDLGCESTCRQLSSTTTIAVYYYYSARKLILIYHPTEGRRLSWPRHCRKGAHSPCPRL